MADLKALLGEARKKSEAEATAAEMRMSLVKLESELAALAGARYEAERRPRRSSVIRWLTRADP